MAITAYFVAVSLVSLACTLVLLRRPHEAEAPYAVPAPAARVEAALAGPAPSAAELTEAVR